jgi:hypothetical protein
MQAKIIILILCLLQLCFLFILVSYNKDVSELIEVGVERLKSNYPSEAPTNSNTSAGETLITPGDFFVAARQDYLFQTTVSFAVTAINILLLVCLLIVLRKKRKIAVSQISKI